MRNTPDPRYHPTWHARDRRPGGQVVQRVEYLKLQCLGGAQAADYQPCLSQPLPEPLDRAAISISQARRAGSILQQTLAGHTGAAGRLEL